MQNRKRVIALGFFDGVHLGHGALLRRVAEVSVRKNAVPAAVTFDNQPRALVSHRQVPLINTPADREALMKERYGMEEVIVLPFGRAMMELPWDRFVTEILAARLGAVHVVAGHDYHFGYRGEGNPQRLKTLCAQLGIGCDIIERVELDGVTVSSTHIRGLIEGGEMEQANHFLGHAHILSGSVLHGKKLGRTIGIPTANLAVPRRVIVPAYGVYASRIILPDRTCLAVTNVGVRPTVEDHPGVSVEPWILDFEGDLYGKTVRLEFYRRLRGEEKFPSLEALKEEILRNAEQTRRYFSAI